MEQSNKQEQKDNKKPTHEDIVCMRYHMRMQGITTYTKKSIIRTLIGGGMIIVGLATFLIPFTTIPLCVGGAGLIGYDMRALIHKIRYESHLIKIRSQNSLKSVRGLIYSWGGKLW